ncbi:MAG: GNAT family N-acetyltransferase [Firmicutes bacterium]|nr:GNAT family N-acetyltransferase [Bacillota bacterium]MCM1401796.1 GNAT family N-acetyltransferase [Bacteroides sp.]MCM1477667.1 GNAT family N-acetyltransferase [Bacteroides sp.]
MNRTAEFDLSVDAKRLPYTEPVAMFCNPFSCNDPDLDEFFSRDSFFYDVEMIGKTYAWVMATDPKIILGLITLANDSVKTNTLAASARNRLQRSVTNAKRGINFPAVLIGRLGVAGAYQGKGFNIGSQIIDYVKDWFRSSDNKTGCRFIVVDAYNNTRTIRFYERNGFKTLYKTEREERDFLGLDDDEPLETRFMFYDLKR